MVVLSTAIAQAEISFSRLAQLNPAANELAGRFSQQKYLATLDVTLLSSGRFSFKRGQAIRWQILEPIQNELTITPAGLTSRQGDDELLRLDADTSPAASVLGEIMFAVLSTRWQQLEQYFEVSGDIDGPRWQVRLQPRGGAVAQLFDRVELRGENTVEMIVLYETGGDITTIQLDPGAE